MLVKFFITFYNHDFTCHNKTNSSNIANKDESVPKNSKELKFFRFTSKFIITFGKVMVIKRRAL